MDLSLQEPKNVKPMTAVTTLLYPPEHLLWFTLGVTVDKASPVAITGCYKVVTGKEKIYNLKNLFNNQNNKYSHRRF